MKYSRYLSRASKQISTFFQVDAVPKLLILSGPSGIGKGTISQMLLNDERFGDRFAFCVSHTTRKIRSKEIEGSHYYFVSSQAMENAISRDEFVEYTRAAHGVLYGTSVAELYRLFELNKVAVLDIDGDGVTNICSRNRNGLNLDIRCVGLIPSNMQELENRLRNRGSETETQIIERLARADKDINFCKNSSLVNACIVNEDSWKVGYPTLINLLSSWWPNLFEEPRNNG